MTTPLSRAAVGSAITAGMFNQIIDVIEKPPIAKVLKSSAQSLSGTPNTNSAVLWDVEAFDAFGMHDNASNTSRLTVPPGWGGYYQANARCRTTQTTGTFVTQLAVNGTPQAFTGDRVPGTATGPFGRTTDIFLLSPGDYVEVLVQADISGPALNPGSCAFSLMFVHV